MDLNVEQPPRRYAGRPSELGAKMAVAATKYPGLWVRIADLTTKGSADTTAHELRAGKRVKTRPAGTWGFRAIREPGRFGVLAIVIANDEHLATALAAADIDQVWTDGVIGGCAVDAEASDQLSLVVVTTEGYTAHWSLETGTWLPGK